MEAAELPVLGTRPSPRPIPRDWTILLVNPQWGIGTPSYVRMGDPRGRFRWIDTEMPAASIRFLAENLAGSEILEYPSRAAYEQRLRRGVDVVAISFYTYQMDEVRWMVSVARELGVREVWGGGWGIDTPGARSLFDRSFSGYGEDTLPAVVGDRFDRTPRHPVLLAEGRFFGLRSPVGYLYTIRGCKYKCEYCPTPSFIPERRIQPLPEIERVLDAYVRAGVGCVIIWDETFLTDGAYSRSVVEMLRDRGLLWFCLTSSVELVGRVSRLRDTGFVGCLIGIESLRDETLREYRRGRPTSLNLRVVREMRDNGCFLVGSYLLCHDRDTRASLRADVDKLASLEIGGINPCILTPYAPTPLYERYRSRIVDWNWKNWDDGHLVWKHPEVGPVEARGILEDCIYRCAPPGRTARFLAAESISRILPYGMRHAWFGPTRILETFRRAVGGTRAPGPTASLERPSPVPAPPPASLRPPS